MFQTYKKRPVQVQAVQLTEKNLKEVLKFLNSLGSSDNRINSSPKGVVIHTLEGDMLASFGDYIIQGIHGELYPCKPDIFEKTYETVEPPKEEH